MFFQQGVNDGGDGIDAVGDTTPNDKRYTVIGITGGSIAQEGSDPALYDVEGVILVGADRRLRAKLSGKVSADIAGLHQGRGGVGPDQLDAPDRSSRSCRSVTARSAWTSRRAPRPARCPWSSQAPSAFDFGGVLQIEGDFSVDNTGAFSGTDLIVFVGSGPGYIDGEVNPDAIGLLITNASVYFKQGTGGAYALYVTGNVALLGLDGLEISGLVTFQINTGTANHTFEIELPEGQTCPTSQPTCDQVTVSQQTWSLVVANLRLGVTGVLQVRGTLVVNREPNGTLNLTLGNADLLVGLDGQGIISLSGYAAFVISPLTGFRLAGFKVSGFTLFPDMTEEEVAETIGDGRHHDDHPDPGALPDRRPGLPAQRRDRGPRRLPARRPPRLCGGTAPASSWSSTTSTASASTRDSIKDPNPEFEVWYNGAKVNLTLATPTPVTGKVNTWRYTFSGWTPTGTGVVEIRFLANGFSDYSGTASMAETERFFLVAAEGDQPGPIATLVSPLNGQSLSAAELNARRYLDVTYTSLNGKAIDKTSIEDVAPEFRISGAGVLDLMRDASGAPVIVGLPVLIDGFKADATTVTYRYYFKDRTRPTPSTCSVRARSPSTSSAGRASPAPWSWASRPGPPSTPPLPPRRATPTPRAGTPDSSRSPSPSTPQPRARWAPAVRSSSARCRWTGRRSASVTSASPTACWC